MGAKVEDDPIVEKKAESLQAESKLADLPETEYLIRKALATFAETMLDITDAVIPHSDPTGEHHDKLLSAKARLLALKNALMGE